MNSNSATLQEITCNHSFVTNLTSLFMNVFLFCRAAVEEILKEAKNISDRLERCALK